MNFRLLCAAAVALVLFPIRAEPLVAASADFSDPFQTRLIRDYPVKLNLAHAEGVQFDFLCTSVRSSWFIVSAYHPSPDLK